MACASSAGAAPISAAAVKEAAATTSPLQTAIRRASSRVSSSAN